MAVAVFFTTRIYVPNHAVPGDVNKTALNLITPFNG
jgi:hypothetical protein